MDGAHSSPDHGSHGSNDACAHAVDHYDHAVHSFSSHAGHAVDSIFGHDNFHDHSPGAIVQDTMNVYGARQEMNAACGYGNSADGG